MLDPAQGLAAAVLLAMIAYLVTGGADFGGGVWELFARGPRAPAHVRALREAIAPIWEANHVWLILVVVLLFLGFPGAFAPIMIALHVPITILLVGIVLRGAAFVFQAYADGDEVVARQSVRWFRVASLLTPVALGVVAGAVAGGMIRVDVATGAVTASVRPWLQPFPVAVGVMTLGLCAYLAAVYMTLETTGALQEDFRRRALAAGAVVGVIALPVAALAWHEAPILGVPLLTSWWSWPFHVATGAIAIAALWAMLRRHFRTARMLAIAQTAAILIGWALAQYPRILAPDLRAEDCAAPRVVLVTALVVLAVGSLLLLPAFVWLYRAFKRN